jgi:hypothetical protein
MDKKARLYAAYKKHSLNIKTQEEGKKYTLLVWIRRMLEGQTIAGKDFRIEY